MNLKQNKIGLLTATVVGMNAMIGAGIFSVPAALGSHVGPAGIISYAFVIVAVWFLGQSFARLAQLYPEEGSFYVYASKWGGHIMGLLSAGAYLTGLIIAMGLLLQISGIYLHVNFPEYSSTTLSIITLIALTILNIVGVHLSRSAQMILIACTVFPIIATTIICFMYGSINNYFPFMPYGATNILAATQAVIFGFFGFESAASLFNIVNKPEKNVPRALILSITLVGLLYILFVGSIIYAIPLKLLSANIPLTESLKMIFPRIPWLINLIHISILSAIIGTIHSMIWSSSELLLAYLNKLGIAKLSNLIKRKIITQRWMVLLICLASSSTLLLLKDIDLFFSLTASFVVFAFVTSLVTLLTLKSEWKSKQNIKTIIGLMTALLIFYFAIVGIINAL